MHPVPQRSYRRNPKGPAHRLNAASPTRHDHGNTLLYTSAHLAFSFAKKTRIALLADYGTGTNIGLAHIPYPYVSAHLYPRLQPGKKPPKTRLMRPFPLLPPLYAAIKSACLTSLSPSRAHSKQSTIHCGILRCPRYMRTITGHFSKMKKYEGPHRLSPSSSCLVYAVLMRTITNLGSLETHTIQGPHRLSIPALGLLRIRF